MPLLLYSYLLSEMAAPFWASLAILTGVLFLGQMLQTLTLVFALGIGLADFLRLTLYLLPKLLMFSLPLASMLGVILGFNRLGADNEFLALRAAGVRRQQILIPVTIFALTVTLMAGYSSICLMPKGQVNMKVLLLKLSREKIDRGIKEQAFSQSLGGIVAYVDRIDPATRQWQGIYLYDGRRPESPMTITAKGATLDVDYQNLLLGLHLSDGTIDYLDQQLSRHIDFQAYTLNLPVPLPNTVQMNGVRPTEMSQEQLLTAATAAAGTPLARSLLVEYHQRLILAVGCLILTLLGLPFAARSRPGARPIAVPIGLLLFLLYYVLFSFAENTAKLGGVSIPLTLWAPNLAFMVLTTVVIMRMDSESLIPIPAALGAAVDRLLALRPRRREAP
jgi:lipopolysaccharide export system permease protein